MTVKNTLKNTVQNTIHNTLLKNAATVTALNSTNENTTCHTVFFPPYQSHAILCEKNEEHSVLHI